MKIGIDKLAFYVPRYYLDMDTLAEMRGADPAKFHIGLEIDEMAVTGADEDLISLGANAAAEILTDDDRKMIDMIIVGTESSVDESKSAAVVLHDLLKIQPFARSLDMKEACYGATAGLLMARDYVACNPTRKVLVIATDIARYGLKSVGEPTQGAGAVAMLVSAGPRILALDEESLALTQDIYDFWRPTGEVYPRVNGKLSNETYIAAFEKVWTEYSKRTGRSFADFAALAFHTPYPKMGKKALSPLIKGTADEKRLLSELTAATSYNRRVGNLYTGSLFLSFISLLENSKNLKSGDKIGLFSYGSGTVSEFFSGELQENFEQQLRQQTHQSLLDQRQKLSAEDYEILYNSSSPLTLSTSEKSSELAEKNAAKVAFRLLDKTDGVRTYNAD